MLLVGILDSFNAFRSISYESLSPRLTFDVIFTTPSNSLTKAMRISPQNFVRYYWFRIALDVPASTMINLQLMNLINATFNMLSSLTDFNDTRTVSASSLFVVKLLFTYWMMNEFQFSSATQTAFRLDNICYPFEAFRIARTFPAIDNTIITFDKVIANI